MRKYICEAIGTLFLVLIGCGVAVATTDLVATSLAFGLTLMLMCYIIGPVSGCHINPAISLSMYLTKKISLKELALYILSQIMGALLGSLLLATLIKTNTLLGANSYGGAMLADTALIALLVEALLTFVFTLTVLCMTSSKDNAKISGLIIGLALTLVHLLGISFTGTSVNPARSLAPAILQGGTALSQVWVFIVGPMLGAIIASIFFQTCLNKRTD